MNWALVLGLLLACGSALLATGDHGFRETESEETEDDLVSELERDLLILDEKYSIQKADDVPCGDNFCEQFEICDEDGKTCRCPDGKTGEDCKEDVCSVELKAQCEAIGATCIQDPLDKNAGTCECTEPKKKFDGEKCADLCGKNVCMHYEICDEDGETCRCPEGKTGVFCEDLVCSVELNKYCQEIGATCIQDPLHKNAGTCECTEPKKKFDGKNCVGTCASDKDCDHLGKCKAVMDGKFCKCKNGTSGDFCEKVDECVDNPVKCGTLDDVSCVFDIEKEFAVCKCDNETKTYVDDEERCMSPIKLYRDCGENVAFFHEVGKQKFCACKQGASGDYCEIIDQCHNKTVDCGVDNKATCKLGGKGKAYCKCDDETKGFDYDQKICKGCEGCGEHIYVVGACVYRNGIRRCACDIRYYSSENGTCEDCKCGQDAYGCKFENGTKICQCWSGAANKDGYCQKCDCGSGLGVSSCEFKDGKKICTCKEGYKLAGPNGPCTQMCNATNLCANGGKCVQNVCNCLEGTSGDFCQTIADCDRRGKCGSADCLYNVTSKEAYCKCNGSLVYDDYYKMCNECNCGYYTESCTFVDGRKRCNCTDPFADRRGTCELCYCKGLYSSMYGCKFGDYGELICPCLKGYAQSGDECKKCDCGDHGKCQLYGLSKTCTCDEGYSEYNGQCKECNCGKKGSCLFDYSGKKTCYCESGYEDYQGTCKVCDCGRNSKCEFNKNGSAECSCQPYYGMKHGVCTACNCSPGTSCKFNSYDSKKICICPKGYSDYNGRCSECDCEVEGSTCTFPSGGFNRCKCPPGYEEKSHPTKGFTKICVVMDVCRNSNPCPPSSTKCETGKLGSYKCVCKPGYEWLYSKDDIERRGCEDINECYRDYKPCDDDDATCVNTPGSYRCECRAGYIYRASVEKKNVCHVPRPSTDTRPWRIGSIVVGVSAAVIIVGLLIAICQKYDS